MLFEQVLFTEGMAIAPRLIASRFCCALCKPKASIYLSVLINITNASELVLCMAMAAHSMNALSSLAATSTSSPTSCPMDDSITSMIRTYSASPGYQKAISNRIKELSTPLALSSGMITWILHVRVRRSVMTTTTSIHAMMENGMNRFCWVAMMWLWNRTQSIMLQYYHTIQLIHYSLFLTNLLVRPPHLSLALSLSLKWC
jgi:hypothetical protein